MADKPIFECVSGVKFGVHGWLYVKSYNGEDTHIVIPATIDGKAIEGIAKYGFNSNDSLVSIEISEGIKSISHGAFCGCRALESVIIPESITSIFDGFQRLGGVSSLAGNFSECPVLKYVTLPKGLKKIGSHAFSDCKSLQTITIPENVEEIGAYAFSNCPALETIVIPKSVKKIGTAAFRYCSSLHTVTFLGTEIEIKNSGEKYGAFGDCPNLSEETTAMIELIASKKFIFPEPEPEPIDQEVYPKNIMCPECLGAGKIYMDGGNHYEPEYYEGNECGEKCYYCDGRGSVDI